MEERPTAGGLKQFRVHLMWRKLLVWDLKRALAPRTTVLERPLWEGDRLVGRDGRSVLARTRKGKESHERQTRSASRQSHS